MERVADTVGTQAGGCRGVDFVLRVDRGMRVYVAGTFNDWDPRQIRLEETDGTGAYKATIELPRGRHEYKFVVNGVWHPDLNCPHWTPNAFGSLNSVVVV